MQAGERPAGRKERGELGEEEEISGERGRWLCLVIAALLCGSVWVSEGRCEEEEELRQDSQYDTTRGNSQPSVRTCCHISLGEVSFESSSGVTTLGMGSSMSSWPCSWRRLLGRTFRPCRLWNQEHYEARCYREYRREHEWCPKGKCLHQSRCGWRRAYENCRLSCEGEEEEVPIRPARKLSVLVSCSQLNTSDA